MCSTSKQVEDAKREKKKETEVQEEINRRSSRLKTWSNSNELLIDNNKEQDKISLSFGEDKPLEEQQDEEGGDKMSKKISLYTDSIANQARGHVGRPAKKLSKKIEMCSSPNNTLFDTFVYNEEVGSPTRHPKECKVKEKIEKLLRSPWDNRLKSKVGIKITMAFKKYL